VGCFQSEIGLCKASNHILESLGNDISANCRICCFQPYPPLDTVPFHTRRALTNPDPTPGKVTILSAALWYYIEGFESYQLMPKESTIKIAYSMFETTGIHAMWVKILNEEFDAVVVPDSYLVDAYKNSGVNIPIFVLPIPMMLNDYLARPAHSESPSTPFIFGDASINKNPGVLVEAFAKAFGNNPNVHLVVRAISIASETRHIIHHMINHYGLTNVTIEEGVCSLIDRLASFDCYVNLSKGEGFSFIHREALALGIPVITSNNTALTTVCNSGCVRVVPSNKKVPPLAIYHMLFREDYCGDQFDCEVEDATAALLDVYNNYGKYIQKARQGREWVQQYNVANPTLRREYLTLVKPEKVVLGNDNVIEGETIITNSSLLYQKYQQLIDDCRKGN
jgi:glycosyltransferase involved in cell wall biosynthesis